MRKYSKSMLIILVALSVWAIVNFLFIMNVVDFALRRNDLLYLYLYYTLMHLVIGFGIGWYSKSKGWLLGLVFGIVVIMISCILPLSSDVFKSAVSDIGCLDALRKAIVSPPTVIVIVCSTIGGFVGSRLRGIHGR